MRITQRQVTLRRDMRLSVTSSYVHNAYRNCDPHTSIVSRLVANGSNCVGYTLLLFDSRREDAARIPV